jgi:hypothetical protein
MKYLISLCSGLLLFIACSRDNGVAVTQTGNPTQVSLLFKADTTTTAPVVPLAKKMATNLLIHRAYLVVYRVEMEPVDGTEFVLFKGPHPYVIELLPNGGKGLIDSVHVPGNNSYESIKIEFGPLNDTSSTSLIPEGLIGNSIFVEGSIGTDTLTPFTFKSKMSESLEYEIDSTLVLPALNSAQVLVKVRVFDWFRDAIGQFIDPGDSANRAVIEKNIAESMEVEEETNVGEYGNNVDNVGNEDFE